MTPDAVPELDPALHALALQWRSAGVRMMAVTVARARGSVPRGAGTTMLVTLHDLAGTIGGGRLEHDAVARARALLAGVAPGAPPQPPSRPQSHRVPLALGPSLGQCCGGALDLLFAPVDAAWLAAARVTPPAFHLMLYGAGHVGRAIARLLADLPCRLTWVDTRDDAFDTGCVQAAHIERVVADPAEVEAEADTAPDGAFHLVLTHDHALDQRIVAAVLRRDRFGFLGLIGSATKRARFARRLLALGVPEARVARITCPIGLPGIADKRPAAIAIATVAQLLQLAEARPTERLAQAAAATR